MALSYFDRLGVSVADYLELDGTCRMFVEGAVNVLTTFIALNLLLEMIIDVFFPVIYEILTVIAPITLLPLIASPFILLFR